MLEHRAAVQQQLVQQEAEGLHRLNLDREQVLNRLWEIANLSPDMTRGSITGQVKALSMIVAMQNFIPDRRALSAEKKPAPASVNAQIYEAECLSRHAVELRKQQATTIDPQPSHAPNQEEDEPARPASPGKPWSVPWGVPEPKLAPGPVAEAPTDPGTSQSTFANRFTPSQAPPPYVSLFTSVPDLGVPFSIKNPFVCPR